MRTYRLVAEPRVELDIEGAFDRYESEQPELGVEFLIELRAAYDRIAQGPLRYQILRSDIRRALVRRFPYAVYFSVESEFVVVVAVLHARRDPTEWQRLR